MKVLSGRRQAVVLRPQAKTPEVPLSLQGVMGAVKLRRPSNGQYEASIAVPK